MPARKRPHSRESQPRRRRSPEKLTDKKGLYLRNDSNEFIVRYIQPELARIYGSKVLQHVGDIDIERSMTVPNRGEGGVLDYLLTIKRDMSEKIPFVVDLSITERRELTDEEVLVAWPLIREAELAEELKEKMVLKAASVYGIEEEDAEELIGNNVVELMHRESDILEETDLEQENIVPRMFELPISVFARRSLLIRRRSVPEFNFQTGFIYDGMEYYKKDGGWFSDSGEVVGDTPAEASELDSTLRELHHEVDHDQAVDFIAALARLGFRP